MLVATGLPAGAHATEARAQLDVGPEGIAGCPTADELADAVAARLGYLPFVEDAERRVIVGFERKSGRIVARVTVREASGRVLGPRTLEAPKRACASLRDPIALAVAIALDPHAAFGKPTPEADAVAKDHRTRDEPRVRDRRRPPQKPPRPRRRARARDAYTPRVDALPFLGTTVALGALPGPAAGPELGATVGRGPVAIELEAAALFPRTRELRSGRGARVWGARVSVAPCGRWKAAFGCLALGAGATRSSGFGVTSPRTELGPSVSMGPRAGVWIPIGSHARIRVAGELALALTRNRLALDGEEVWSTPGIGAWLSIAGGWHLP